LPHPSSLASTHAPARRHSCSSSVDADIEFIRRQRQQLVVLLEIERNADSQTVRSELRAIAESDFAALEGLLRDGQGSGEFRAFDPRLIAVYIIALRNAVMDRLVAQPDLDLDVYARELNELLRRATHTNPLRRK
jgi:hypothetical protein